MNRNPRRSPGPRGFTLVETVISLVILSIVMGSLMSVMVMATHALPDSDDPSITSADITSALELIMADAMLASAITVDTSSLKLVIPDRTLDGKRELIRYGLTAPDSPPTTLHRSFNNNGNQPLVGGVAAFKASVVSYDSKCSLLVVEIATSRGDVHRAGVELLARPEITK